MATKKVESKIEIPAMDFRMATLHVVGDSPLIVHAWSEKAKRMMLEKQMKKATKGKEVRDPFAEFLDSLYWLSERPADVTPENFSEVAKTAKFGFPALAFKAAAVNGVRQGTAISACSTLSKARQARRAMLWTGMLGYGGARFGRQG